MLQKCPLCERHKEDGERFCNFHNTALANLEEGFAVWKRAFSDLSRSEYYARLEELENTGTRVRELIQYLRRFGKV
jgi:hypothetical protein